MIRKWKSGKKEGSRKTAALRNLPVKLVVTAFATFPVFQLLNRFSIALPPLLF
jgi:hypothetical protein